MHYICAEQVVAYKENGNKVEIKEPLKSITDVDTAARFLEKYLKNLPFERLAMVAINAAGEILGINTVATGSTTKVAVPIRNIFTFAFLLNASAIVLGHNHPGGAARASDEDIDLTRKVKQLCNDLDLDLLDHIIIAKGSNYYSMHSHGII